jgi:hypothetical protein
MPSGAAPGKIAVVPARGRHGSFLRGAVVASRYLRSRLGLFAMAMVGVLVFAFLPLCPITVPVIGALVVMPALLLRLRQDRGAV